VRQARRNAVVLLATLAVSVSVLVGEATANLNAATANASTFSTAAIYSPTAPTAAPLGHTASVSWTASSPSTGNGYVVSAVNVGSNAATACPAAAASYSFVGGTASTSFTDSTAMAGGTDGTYVCYLPRRGFDTTAPGSWVADPVWVSANTLPTAKTAIGFFATTLTLANGGVAGRIDSGDTVVITFDQSVNTAGLTVSQVCAAVGSKTIYLGAGTGIITCPTTASIGTLTGINVSSTLSLDGAWAATAAWTNTNRTLTITIGAQNMGSTISAGAGTTTYVPAALTSSSGAAAICTTVICRPTTSTVP
jgi:hypothetical protein